MENVKPSSIRSRIRDGVSLSMISNHFVRNGASDMLGLLAGSEGRQPPGAAAGHHSEAQTTAVTLVIHIGQVGAGRVEAVDGSAGAVQGGAVRVGFDAAEGEGDRRD